LLRVRAKMKRNLMVLLMKILPQAIS